MQKTDKISVIILAAGDGTRMNSTRPKALHEVAGLPMLGHVLNAVRGVDNLGQIIVVSKPDAQAVRDFTNQHLAQQATHVIQKSSRGTGDAVRVACAALDSDWSRVLVVFSDTPLISPAILDALCAHQSAVTVLGFTPDDGARFGRIIIDKSALASPMGVMRPTQIVEYADATPEQRVITLCNGGAMAMSRDVLMQRIIALDNDNAQGEFYLTDIVAAAHQAGDMIGLVEGDVCDAFGVNNRSELAQAEAMLQTRLRARAIDSGVSLQAPETVYLSHDTHFGKDVYIEPHVIIGRNVRIGDGVRILGFSHIEGATIERDARIGPFARLRPHSVIGAQSRIGNFVELKAAHLGENVKVNHLAYIGDATLGARVNIGAGAITCNYDGVTKHHTNIEAGAFIGSNSALIAPLTIGKDAYLGSGTTIAQNVPAGSLALSRAPTRFIHKWTQRFTAKKKD